MQKHHAFRLLPHISTSERMMTGPPSPMAPPWQEYPTYERYTIGWRMGSGEDYLHRWWDFITKLPTDRETRLAYLRQHRPAPLNWGDAVLNLLEPDRDPDEEFGCSPAETQQLLELGLVQHDAAYQTWLQGQTSLVWPWSVPIAESPRNAARYCTREFWFSSRQISEARESGDFELKSLPLAWRSVKSELATGRLREVDPADGLLTLAKMLCAGQVLPPWKLGLTPDQFTDSFEMDMGYCDAFRLWIMSAFDDDQLLHATIGPVPDEWTAWFDDQAAF